MLRRAAISHNPADRLHARLASSSVLPTLVRQHQRRVERLEALLAAAGVNKDGSAGAEPAVAKPAMVKKKRLITKSGSNGAAAHQQQAARANGHHVTYATGAASAAGEQEGAPATWSVARAGVSTPRSVAARSSGGGAAAAPAVSPRGTSKPAARSMAGSGSS